MELTEELEMLKQTERDELAIIERYKEQFKNRGILKDKLIKQMMDLTAEINNLDNEMISIQNEINIHANLVGNAKQTFFSCQITNLANMNIKISERLMKLEENI